MAGNSVELKGYENVPREQLTPCFPMMALARLAVTPSESDYDGSFGFDWLEYNGSKYTYAQRTDINKLEKFVEFNGGVATFKAPANYEEKEKVLLEEYEKFAVPGYADKPVASSYLHMPKDKEPVKLKLHLFPLSTDEIAWKENELTIEAPVGLDVTLSETTGFTSRKTLDLTIANNGTGKRSGIIKFIDKNEVLVGQIFVQPPDEPIELKVRFVALVEQSTRRADRRNSKTAEEQQQEQHTERAFNLLRKDVSRYNEQTQSYVQWSLPEKMIEGVNKWFRQTGIKFLVDKPVDARDFLVYDRSNNEWRNYIRNGEIVEEAAGVKSMNIFAYEKYKNDNRSNLSDNQIVFFITSLTKRGSVRNTETAGRAMTIPLDCNSIFIYNSGDNVKTYVHELGHLLGLAHTFLEEGDEESYLTNCNGLQKEKDNYLKEVKIDAQKNFYGPLIPDYMDNPNLDQAQKDKIKDFLVERDKIPDNYPQTDYSTWTKEEKDNNSKEYDAVHQKIYAVMAESIILPESEIIKEITPKSQAALELINDTLFQLRNNRLYFTQKETYNMMDYSDDAKRFFFNHKQWNTMCENSKYSR